MRLVNPQELANRFSLHPSFIKPHFFAKFAGFKSLQSVKTITAWNTISGR